MKIKILRAFSILILFVFLLGACSPTVVTEESIAGRTAMSVIYEVSHDTVMVSWLVTGVVLALIFGILAGTFLGGRGFSFGSFLLVGALTLCMFWWIGSVQATKVASHALTSGSDKAKTRKANQYKEKLHEPVLKTVLEVRQCVENDWSSGCRYEWTYNYNYHQVCTTKQVPDSDGEGTHSETECQEEHDTRHVPFFREEWRTYAYIGMPDDFLKNKVCDDQGNNCGDSGTGLVKSDVPDAPTKLFTDWQAPENYDSYWWGASNRDGWETPPALGAFDYVIPGEWKAMDAALKAGRPYVVTVPHDYVNWVFVTQDTNNLVAMSADVERYKAAGLLPQINQIYSKYGSSADKSIDYDFVQFNGIQPANPAEWQDAAGTMALNIGVRLQGSLLIWFVPASAVDSPDAWINAAKTYLSDRNVWGYQLAPKNLILIGCGVDTSTNMISFCRMETGMPSGNVEIIYDMNHVTDVPFTVQGVFGTQAAYTQPDSNGFYETINPVPQDGFVRRLFGRTDAMFAPDEKPSVIEWFKVNAWGWIGFLRVRMQSMDWLKTDIKLDAADINWVVDTETHTQRTVATWTMLIPLAICIVLGIAAANEKGSSRRRF